MKLSSRAYRDLSEIWRYGAREWGSEHAFNYSDRINAALQLLCDQPAIGSIRRFGSFECRRWIVGNHAIMFQVRGRNLYVIRILHATMDEHRHLS